ncbi:MAG: hypothetical protein GX422_17480, partial [Deltaproteobacteria bacterium]|nr:hypothetical protein [Deltaproteobacteria bacterium]
SFLWLTRISLGVLFLFLGLLGLALPIMPGWLLIALGVVSLAPEVPVFNRVVVWIENRFPLLQRPIRIMRGFLERYGGSRAS